MARTKPGYRDLRPRREPDSDLVRELRSACKTDDVGRVRELLDAGSVTPADATSCLRDALQDLTLVRLLLEYGADPSGGARVFYMSRSFALVKLLVEFGYDISINGHCILQDYAHSPESINWLLDHGVDITKTDHERTDDGTRPGQCHDFSLKVLNNVAATGDIEFFDYLVSRGADPHRSLALHCATKCEEPLKMAAMVDHLLDVHNMDIEANNEDLRDFFHAAGDSGTPLNCAVYYHNLPAVKKLLDRGSDPEKAVDQAITNNISEPWLPALGPLLDAGAQASIAFGLAVRYLNVEAAELCLQKGADPTRTLQRQEARAAKRAAGNFVRSVDAKNESAIYSSEDDDERATRREEMRDLVRSAAGKLADSRASAWKS